MDQNKSDLIMIEERTYQNNGTYVSYPLIVSGKDRDIIDLLNNIILMDINKILSIYSADAFTGPTEGPDIYLQDRLNIRYDIMRNDPRFLSILYTADFYSPYAAHPTQLTYTTNIDLQNYKRLKLSDFIQVNDFFIDEFIYWEPAANDMNDPQLIQGIRNYIRGLGREVLIRGFNTADIIGSDNLLGIFSYLKPSKIGISISVPNYLGDHAEFERSIIL